MNFGDSESPISKPNQDNGEVIDMTESEIGVDECTPAKQAKPAVELKKPVSCEMAPFSFTSVVPSINMAGHTGFLTFASLYSKCEN